MVARLIAAFSFAALVVVSPATAQSGGVRGVIDEGLTELVRRQQQDGSYGDVAATADAVLAFGESSRHYVESDGPFVRRAVEWLAAQVDDEGRPRATGAGDNVHLQVARAGWIDEVLERSK